MSTEFIKGLASVDDKMVMLLDVDKLFNVAELPSDEVVETA